MSNQTDQLAARFLEHVRVLASEYSADRSFNDDLRLAFTLTLNEMQMRADGVPMVLAPHYRGYANLGIGAYILNTTAVGDPAELVISMATAAEMDGRKVGEDRDNPPGHMVQPEDMAVRLHFENVAGLDALEHRLRILRADHFGSAS